MAKQKLKTILKCTVCTATADLSKNPKAWNGWQVSPTEICPHCIAKTIEQRQEEESRQADRLQAALAMLEGSQA